jgi:hypothetical protein
MGENNNNKWFIHLMSDHVKFYFEQAVKITIKNLIKEIEGEIKEGETETNSTLDIGEELIKICIDKTIKQLKNEIQLNKNSEDIESRKTKIDMKYDGNSILQLLKDIYNTNNAYKNISIKQLSAISSDEEYNNSMILLKEIITDYVYDIKFETLFIINLIKQANNKIKNIYAEQIINKIRSNIIKKINNDIIIAETLKLFEENLIGAINNDDSFDITDANILQNDDYIDIINTYKNFLREQFVPKNQTDINTMITTYINENIIINNTNIIDFINEIKPYNELFPEKIDVNSYNNETLSKDWNETLDVELTPTNMQIDFNKIPFLVFTKNNNTYEISEKYTDAKNFINTIVMPYTNFKNNGNNNTADKLLDYRQKMLFFYRDNINKTIENISNLISKLPGSSGKQDKMRVYITNIEEFQNLLNNIKQILDIDTKKINGYLNGGYLNGGRKKSKKRQNKSKSKKTKRSISRRRK